MMKINKFMMALLAATYISQVAAIQHCAVFGWDTFGLFSNATAYPWAVNARNDDMANIFPGIAYGFKNSYATSDCSKYMQTLTEDVKEVVNATANMFSEGNVLEPFYRGQTAVVAVSNVNVACQLTAIAAQLNIRFNTAAGLADLMYTIYNVAKEGFFDGLYDETIDNVIWTNSYMLFQGTFGRTSMTCQDVGYHIGAIIQALLSFQVPETIETGNVKGDAVPT